MTTDAAENQNAQPGTETDDNAPVTPATPSTTTEESLAAADVPSNQPEPLDGEPAPGADDDKKDDEPLDGEDGEDSNKEEQESKEDKNKEEKESTVEDIAKDTGRPVEDIQAYKDFYDGLDAETQAQFDKITERDMAFNKKQTEGAAQVKEENKAAIKQQWYGELEKKYGDDLPNLNIEVDQLLTEKLKSGPAMKDWIVKQGLENNNELFAVWAEIAESYRPSAHVSGDMPGIRAAADKTDAQMRYPDSGY